ncbi:MAG: sialate O-acetylesterase [Lentisphaerales bacterium]|nr:sialate O-acetylesterase [Lentisphaerales bacterium]
MTAKVNVFISAIFLISTLCAESLLPAPDGKPANMKKPVQVFILMGQSNMLGFGKTKTLKEIAPEKYPYLIDKNGNWTERKDVRNVRVMSSGTNPMKEFNNEWMTIKGKAIGPEISIGHHLGNTIDAPVLILKSCIGNRSLGWDLLPPGSKQYEFDGNIYPGYKGSPSKWAKGETPKPIGWYAGKQYDGDTANAKSVLKNLAKYYPEATKYEVAGFFWWQGDKDFRNKAHAEKYEENLINLIKALRQDFNTPKAKFVCATLGQTKKGSDGSKGKILNAQLAIDGTTGKYPENKGNVATVYSHPLSKGGSSSSHYSGNPETYMNIGEAMGKAMVELLQTSKAK